MVAYPIVELISVNVARPAYLGDRRGRMIESGIRKPVQGGDIQVSLTNLDGDAQADLRNHGGRDKAIYAYPVDHLPAWSLELHPDLLLRTRSVCENLSTRG